LLLLLLLMMMMVMVPSPLYICFMLVMQVTKDIKITSLICCMMKDWNKIYKDYPEIKDTKWVGWEGKSPL
jgi:hypothetical protein